MDPGGAYISYLIFLLIILLNFIKSLKVFRLKFFGRYVIIHFTEQKRGAVKLNPDTNKTSRRTHQNMDYLGG